MNTPSPNGSNGRTPGGRFTKGNRGGPGNPHAQQVAKLRAAMLKAVTPAALNKVALALIAKAQDGDVPAIRELLDRSLGRPVEADLIERLEQLEAQQQEAQRHE